MGPAPAAYAIRRIVASAGGREMRVLRTLPAFQHLRKSGCPPALEAIYHVLRQSVSFMAPLPAKSPEPLTLRQGRRPPDPAKATDGGDGSS